MLQNLQTVALELELIVRLNVQICIQFPFVNITESQRAETATSVTGSALIIIGLLHAHDV